PVAWPPSRVRTTTSSDAVPPRTGRRTYLSRSSTTRSPHEAGTFAVELPAGNQVAHPDRVVPGPQCLLPVQLVGGEEPFPVEVDTEAGTTGNRDLAVADAGWGHGEPFQAFLPDPVRVQGVVLA